MKSIWKGTMSFGLINIPVKAYSATRHNEMNFHYLHEVDLGRISTERICKKCGQSLGYDELVRGYEQQKGKYIPLMEEDFEKIAVESSKTITITDFVDPQEIEPMFFEKPYYLAPDENGEELYVLLREALVRTHKVGVAKFSWYEREHLAIVKANENALMLNVMHFADEISQPTELTLPTRDEVQVSENELDLAERLVETMTGHFAPERYKSTYSHSLRDLIDKKRAGLEIEAKPLPRVPTQVDELVSKLRDSVEQAEKRRKENVAA
ncbi:MAG TPA: Ku protein [Candidatus Binatia bacterium]|jgi:DNA end-binding protein Ku|nr:Ku protein [Candidatus Binatia bacterium]